MFCETLDSVSGNVIVVVFSAVSVAVGSLLSDVVCCELSGKFAAAVEKSFDAYDNISPSIPILYAYSAASVTNSNSYSYLPFSRSSFTAVNVTSFSFTPA